MLIYAGFKDAVKKNTGCFGLDKFCKCDVKSQMRSGLFSASLQGVRKQVKWG